MESKHSDRLRYRYGMCLNDQCEKCRTKEVQQISARKDFVCEACGKPLRECPPPKSFMQKYGKAVYAVIAVAAIAIAAALILLLGGKDGNTEPESPEAADTTEVTQETAEETADTAALDTAKSGGQPSGLRPEDSHGEEQKVKEPETENARPEAEKARPEAERPQSQAAPAAQKPRTAAATQSTANLGYATYSGPMQNGAPHGTGGKLKFKSSHVIDSRDSQQRVAEPGDYVIGEFKNGHLVSGKWFGSDGVVKGALLIGE